MTLHSRQRRFFPGAAIGTLTVMLLLTSDDARSAEPTTDPEIVTPLMSRDLAGIAGKEAAMLTVEYLPGGASLSHRHDANIFVYVLEGTLIQQVAGQPPVILGPGQTFHENPDDIHVQSANASQTANYSGHRIFLLSAVSKLSVGRAYVNCPTARWAAVAGCVAGVVGTV